MNQKTVRVTDYDARRFFGFGLADIKPGDEFILIERFNERNPVTWYELIPHAGHGAPGNRNRSITRYHGWRGTTDNVATYAHGVRRVTKVSGVRYTKDGCEPYISVTVGKDLHPEWD